MDKVGRYRLTRRLGAGSFATVWMGHDDDLDVPVAVKVLADNWVDNEGVRGRFVAEARILRRIGDPRIVRVYDIGTLEDRRPYFVMDYANAGSLQDLRAQGVEPVPALRLCAEVCRALQVLHDADVIHRDVTPGNVLLNRTASGRTNVLIADLGVAKSATGVVGMTMTAGTPTYMAYEQAIGHGGFDHRVDIYSLTALTYAMLAGHAPYRVRTLADVVSRPADATPDPIAGRIGAPASLDRVLAAGLARDPNRRPPTATLLGDALDRVADELAAAGSARGFTVGFTGSAGTPGTLPPTAAPTQPTAHPGPSSQTMPPRQTGAHPYAGAHPQTGSHPQTGTHQQRMSSPYTVPPSYGQRPDETPRRSTAFYVLLGAGALGVFALVLLITVLALR